MTTDIPSRLEEDPIFECTVEIQFEPGRIPVAEGLPGKLFEEFAADYPEFQRLPESQIPSEVRKQERSLQHKALFRCVGPAGLIGIGDRAVQVAFVRPYPGWSVVKPQVMRVLGSVVASAYVASVRRISIKYQNLIELAESESDLDPLQIEFDIGQGMQTRATGKVIRAEIELNEAIAIVQIQPEVKVSVDSSDGSKFVGQGILLSIDCIAFGTFEPVALEERLNLVHDTEKTVFFRLLKPATLKRLKPVWEA